MWQSITRTPSNAKSSAWPASTAASDVKPIIDALEAGERPGDQIQEIGYAVYKVRVKNTDARRGKSGGYRIIYYLQTADDVLLVTIYSKSDQSDIDDAELRKIITDEERA